MREILEHALASPAPWLWAGGALVLLLLASCARSLRTIAREARVQSASLHAAALAPLRLARQAERAATPR